MFNPAPGSMAVKIYFDLRDDKIGLYRSIRVQESTTFAELHARVSDKIGVSRARSVYFRLVLRYDSPVAHLKRDYAPPTEDLVVATIEREETAWTGEITLMYTDIREPWKRLVETASANAEVQRHAAAGGARLGPAPMTEFFHHSEGTERFSVVAESIAAEVENVCIKKGKLFKMQKGRDSVWRETVVYLDQTRLWFSRGVEGDHALTFLELALHDPVRAVDEAALSLAVRCVGGSSTVLRAKSRAELKEWRVALEGRADFVSENSLIAMADDHISQQEQDRVEDNMRTLSALSEFRGALCNRYLRERFRKYLCNNDEDQLLRFWEYAEDYKLCHAATHRFDAQHDRSAPPPGGHGRTAWPGNYRCSAAESRHFAAFIHDTFLAEGAVLAVRLRSVSAEMLAAAEAQLGRAPRTLFVPLQAAVMAELAQLFYQDFARAQRYRDYFVAASMDLFGCYETDSAEVCPLSPGVPGAALASPPSSRARAPHGTPASASSAHRNSFSLPFPLGRSRSSTGASPVKHYSASLRKATSLDNPPVGRGGAVLSPPQSPAGARPGGIAFSTPSKDPPGSPMSFVFTPSPQPATPEPAATPAAADSAAPDVPEKKGWFSGLRIFKKDTPSAAEKRYMGSAAKNPPAAAAQPGSPAQSPAGGSVAAYSPGVTVATPGSEGEGSSALYRHPMWLQQRASPGDSAAAPWLSDAWWRGKAPAMERYLETLLGGADNSPGLRLYHSYAQWAPGRQLEEILAGIRCATTADSALRGAPTPLGSPAGSFAFSPGGEPEPEDALSPLRDSFEEPQRPLGEAAAEGTPERAPSTRQHVIVWNGGHAHRPARSHRKHRQPQLFQRTGGAGAAEGLEGGPSPREKTEFVVTTDLADMLPAAGSADAPRGRDCTDRHDATRQLHIPIGLYDPRVVHEASNLSTLGSALSKPISCSPYALIFSPEHKLVVHGVPIEWSTAGAGAMRRLDRAGSTGSGKGFSSPSPSFNDRASLSACKSKGGNIFMNRKTEAYARMGELSRQNETEAGRLRAEAPGMAAGAAAPLPPYLGGLRGQVLMWAPVRARYMKHVSHGGGTHVGSSGSTVGSSNASHASSKASYVSAAQKVGASPRHLSASRGLADLTIGSASLPPPPEGDTPPHPRALQEREIDHSDMARYCALLLLCPGGHCGILLYGLGAGGGAAGADGLHEPQLRAVVDLRKATTLSPSSLNAFNIHDETGLIWSVFPEGIDDDDARSGSKRWLDTIHEHGAGEPRGPRVVRIVYEGYLAKRGLLNTAFRRRWFILNSKHQLRYYKEESGQCKGEISISQVLSLEVAERELSLHTKNRLWVLQADSEEEARLWAAAIRPMMLPVGEAHPDGAMDADHGETFVDDD